MVDRQELELSHWKDLKYKIQQHQRVAELYKMLTVFFDDGFVVPYHLAIGLLIIIIFKKIINI